MASKRIFVFFEDDSIISLLDCLHFSGTNKLRDATYDIELCSVLCVVNSEDIWTILWCSLCDL